MAEHHSSSRSRHMRTSLLFGASLLVFLASQLCSASQCFVGFSAGQYPSCEQLSPNVSLHWAVQEGYITWALDIDGVWDWVGVGISEGGMYGADIAVALHDVRAQQWTATDYWSAESGPPQPDQQQDVALVSIVRHSQRGSAYGSTQVALRRPLVTCDPSGQDRPILNDTRQNVIFAYGTGALHYHGTSNRGESGVVLLPNKTAAAAASSGGPLHTAQTLDLRMPTGFTVPAGPTSYQCVNLALPNATKYHIYRYEPLIDNAALVHHFVAYTCSGGDTVPPGGQFGVSYDCLDNMECKELYMAWAPGAGAVDAPALAALAFGAGTGVSYVVLQIHYTNLDGLTGQTDSSGFRLTYSSTLKRYDMGVLTLGSYDIAVPPGAPTWTTAPNICPGTCTTKLTSGGAADGGDAGGVTLVQSFYHMHELGRRMVTRHVRGGVELPPLGARDYFAFDYQAPADIPPGTRQLLPGDVLITTCTYSGVGRTNVTTFGLASYEEMCFNFLTYYPYNPSVSTCIALRAPNDLLAMCTTNGAASHFEGQNATQAGLLVPVPKNLTYRPYQPTCVRSIAAGPNAAGDSSGGAIKADDDGDDGDGGGGGSSHHKRNVGGAVAAILIVTVVGAIAIVAVYRTMKKKRQAEEEQHLFEKYNPNSIVLPVFSSNPSPATATSGIAFGSMISTTGSAAANGSNAADGAPPMSPPGGKGDGSSYADGAAAVGVGLGPSGKGYSALPTQVTGT